MAQVVAGTLTKEPTLPRYFFDIHDGERQFRDDEGQEFADLNAAREEAIGILPDIARDELPDGDRREFKSSIRDENGRVVFRASLALVAGWVGANDP